MAGLADFSKINANNINPTMGASNNAKTENAVPKTTPSKNDSVELSTKKTGNQTNGFAKVALFLAATAAVVCGGTYGGVKIYDKYFQKLASGIKKGEINEALFNFIKKSDPKGNLFHSKEEIIKINEKLTDENFLILKQLSKMKEESRFYYGRDGKLRFNLDEITELLTNTNESNIKYLNQLAQKQQDKYGVVEYMSSKEIMSVLRSINPKNDKIAGQLIEKAGIGDVEALNGCLNKINDKNIDIYSLVLSTRRKGGPTELSFSEISDIAKTLEKTKNPKCAELILNAEKKNGSGTFRHTQEEIEEFLKYAKEENIEAYKKMYDMKCTYEITKMKPLFENVNDDNISILEPLLTKEYKSSFSDNYVLFDDWDNISNILKETNQQNNKFVSDLIEICDSKRLWNISNRCNTSDAIEKVLQDCNSSSQKLERAKGLLKEGVVDGEQTLTFENFYKKFLEI